MQEVAANTLDGILADKYVRSSLLVISESCGPESGVTATLVFKYGFDGFTGDTHYQQLDESGKPVDDSKILGSSMVDLQLVVQHGDGRTESVYKNELLNSSKSIRPLR